MQIILLDETRFDDFASNHPNKNLYQTVNYGRMMGKQGHNSYYLGLVDDSNTINAATLLIVKNEKNDKRKMGYAPRGFLIDWNNKDLVEEFTNQIKSFLIKRSFTYIKLDPPVIYKEYDLNNNAIDVNPGFVSRLQTLGYIHLGYNAGLETYNPRWNAINILNNNIIILYNSITKSARDKIKKASIYGNKVYKGSNEDIGLFYSILNKQKPSLEYYLDFYQFFNQNNSFEIYFTKLEPASFVNSSKNMYEKEEKRNQDLNNLIQNSSIQDKDTLINDKINSDNLITKYKKDMQNAISLFQTYPSGIITAAIAVIKYGKTVTIIDSGINNIFKDNNPSYLLKWQLISKFAKEGYNTFDFNGIIKDYKKEEKYLENSELANKIVEYVGEFDLVINKKSYYTGNKLNPIINWLNTPI